MAIYELRQPPIRDGNTTLKRQDRIDLKPGFHCVSWREKREPSQSNRRFYVERNACWSLPIEKAREMMQRARQESFFDLANIDDQGTIKSVIIAKPGERDYEQQMSKALVGGDFEHEWQNSTAVICNQTCGMWRKVMLANTATGKVTFRSLTSDSSYSFAHREASVDGWHLDRAMLDAHPTAFAHWLDCLQSLAANASYMARA